MAHEFTPIEEVIGATESLKELTDAQKKDIATILGNRFGELYRDLDNTIERITGVLPNAGEKTYAYLERATSGLNNSIETYKSNIARLGGEVADLKKQLESGESKDVVEKLNKELANTKELYARLKEDFDNNEKAHAGELFKLQVRGELDAAMASLQFKKGLSEGMVELAKRNAIDVVMGKNPELVEGRIVYNDNDHNMLRNTDNGLNPFTSAELLKRELETLGVLGETKGGGGTKPNPNGNEVVTFMQARSQVEFNQKASEYLATKGYKEGTQQFQTELTKLWRDNNVNNLPLQ